MNPPNSNNKKTISTSMVNTKKYAIVPFCFGVLILIFYFFIYQIGVLLLALFIFTLSFSLYKLSTKKWKVVLHEKEEIITISDKKKSFTIHLSNLSNIYEYSHLTPRSYFFNDIPYTNYAITLVQPIEIGDRISFSIKDEEEECIKNLNYLKKLVIKQRREYARKKFH